jgi:hypothetical protein
LPKWYGKPGEAETFAQTVADRISGAEGDLIYFEVALDLNCCRPKQQMPSLSWERVKQGFATLEQLYGATNRQANALAFMAVRQGDTETQNNSLRASVPTGTKTFGAARKDSTAAGLLSP